MIFSTIWDTHGLVISASKVSVGVGTGLADSAGRFPELRISLELKASHYLGNLRKVTQNL